jgi:hypothetical protein
VAKGIRIRAKWPRWDLEGNVIQEEGPQARCNYVGYLNAQTMRSRSAE